MEQTKIMGMPYERGRWIFIPISIILFICLGTVYSWSVFRGPVEEVFNIGATKSGMPYMIFLASYAAFMPIAGSFIDKYSAKLIIILGGLAVGFGWILSGFVSNINMLTITYGLVAGGGVGIIYGVPITVISKWFPDKKGLAVGLILSGFGLSPLITAPIARVLIENYGPLHTFKILGVVFLVVITVLATLFKVPEKNIIDKFKKNNEEKNNAENITTKDMFKKTKFYGLWICYAIGTLVGLMTVGITSAVAQEIIMLDAKQAAFMVSFFAIFNGCGRPLFGWLTDKLSPIKASIIAYGIILVASVLMLNAKEGSVLLYVVSFSLLWMTLGSWLSIAPTATTIFFGPKHYSKNYGFVFTAYGVGAVLGVSISGFFRDYFGSYIYTFYAMIVIAIIGMIFAIIFLKETKEEKLPTRLVNDIE